ncbi:PepSY-like domain-containing protein [Rufibacter roseus]|uniref:PepSY-like domain-containing protein n=2 Tax=Rufibacter roseus TaxID=1567108 RepID=A0ABW2DLA8_9BACT|nr:PepSY-like domain-containing protein [Rufibacter roseus]
MLQIIIATAGITALGCSQRLAVSNVPSLVQNSLKTQFPAAANIEWDKQGNSFEAEFDLNQTEHTALLDATGKILMYKHDVDTTQLPEPVMSSIKRDFAAYVVDDLEKVEKDGQTFYQVELESSSNQDLTKVFAQDGTQSSISYWD